jgi:hypothetical protein
VQGGGKKLHITKANRGAGVPAWAPPHLPLNCGKNFLNLKTYPI